MATLDLLTAAEALSAVGGATADVTELAYYTEAVSLSLDHWCGPVVQRTVTTEQLDADGSIYAYTKLWPIISMTTVTEYGTALTEETDVTSPPADGFRLTPLEADPSLYGPRLVRRADGADQGWYQGRGTVIVTYEAGRFANTAAVDQRFKNAARLTLQNVWRSEQVSTQIMSQQYDMPTQSFPTFGLPNAAKHLLVGEIQRDPNKHVVVA